MQPQLFDVVVEAPRPDVEIRVSERRRKTVAAYWEGERIVIVFPPRVAKRDRQAYVDELSAKLIASRAKSRPTDAELHERAVYLSRTYLANAARPTSVVWSTRQNSRWGSCTAADGSIRISARLQGAPQFVIDAVLVHELAHLVHSEHNAAFYELANRFPRQHDADLFLKGMSFALSHS
jgi:predicted metal-dependent hydrolase